MLYYKIVNFWRENDQNDATEISEAELGDAPIWVIAPSARTPSHLDYDNAFDNRRVQGHLTRLGHRFLRASHLADSLLPPSLIDSMLAVALCTSPSPKQQPPSPNQPLSS